MGCQWLAGSVSRVCLNERGGIMIGSSDNSGGVVVGALACGIVACSNLALCFDFFSLVELENASLWPLGPGNLVCAHGYFFYNIVFFSLSHTHRTPRPPKEFIHLAS